MKKYFVILITVCISLLFVRIAMAGVTVSPSSTTIPRITGSTRNITYHVSKSIGPNDLFPPPAVSNQGIFKSGATLLGRVKQTISVPFTVSNNMASGSATEALNIPVSVIRNAERLGVSRFKYKRVFTESGSPSQAVLTIQLSSLKSELRVQRIQLYFKNKRAQITVPKGEKNLKTFANIKYEGEGLFQAFWQVDGRLISRINKQLTFRKSLKLETPDIPALPTFVEGSHEVKLIITRPVPDFDLPRAVYYVRVKQADQMGAIDLTRPVHPAVLSHSPVTFKWRSRTQYAAYLIQFREPGNDNTFFSAYTRKAEYAVPSYVLKYIFNPGIQYTWQVQGFDSKGNRTGESKSRDFRFKTE